MHLALSAIFQISDPPSILSIRSGFQTSLYLLFNSNLLFTSRYCFLLLHPELCLRLIPQHTFKVLVIVDNLLLVRHSKTSCPSLCQLSAPSSANLSYCQLCFLPNRQNKCLIILYRCFFYQVVNHFYAVFKPNMPIFLYFQSFV